MHPMDHFLGHWHKRVVQRMADLLPHTQPPAPALGMNNSETETPSTLTRLSTTDGKCYDLSNREKKRKKSDSQKIMDNVSHTPM